MSTEKENREEKTERLFDSENQADANDQTDANDRPDAEDSGEAGDREESPENDGVEKDGNKEESVSELDWENRVLCEDGNCIGVIGSDGRCKECGRPYEGDLGAFSPKEGADSSDFVPSDDYDIPSDAEAETGESAENSRDEENDGDIDDSAENPDSAFEWEQRQLCSDGNCIGVIGPDGFCKECGKPYENGA